MTQKVHSNLSVCDDCGRVGLLWQWLIKRFIRELTYLHGCQTTGYGLMNTVWCLNWVGIVFYVCSLKYACGTRVDSETFNLSAWLAACLWGTTCFRGVNTAYLMMFLSSNIDFAPDLVLALLALDCACDVQSLRIPLALEVSVGASPNIVGKHSVTRLSQPAFKVHQDC